MENIRVKEVWAKCLEFIKNNIPENEFELHFRVLEPMDLLPDNTLVLMAPTMFFVEQIEKHYINLVWAALQKEVGPNSRLAYRVKMQSNISQKEAVTDVSSINRKNEMEYYNPESTSIKLESDLASRLNTSKNFDTFIEGESNRLARMAGIEISKAPGVTPYNPFFIHSSVGLGKTHLLHAIGLNVRELFPRKRVLFIEAEEFVKQFSNASLQNKRNDFVHFYQNVDVLLMDNVQFLSKKEGTQDVFFHIFNHLMNNGKQVVLSSDRAPIDMVGFEDRLLSRFKWGLSAEIKNPDTEMRKKILQQMLRRDGIKMQEEIIDYLASNVKTNIRELEGVNTSLVAESLFNRNEITFELAQKVVQRIVKSPAKITTMLIQNVVLEYFGVSVEELQSASRKRNIVQARQLAMYLARNYTDDSLKTIGEQLGKRDHATVLHACKTVVDLSDTDKEFSRYLTELTSMIGA